MIWEKNSIYGAIVFYIPEKGRRKKKGEIFVEGKYFLEGEGKGENYFLRRRIIMEKEQEENIRRTFFVEEKTEKEKEKIFSENEKQRRK